VIIDGLLSHYLSADLVLLLRVSPRVLEKRLRKRGYPSKKILENLLAEYCDVILAELLSMRKRFVQINATGKKAEEIARQVVEMLSRKKLISEQVDWLGSEAGFLEKVLKKYGKP